MPEGGVGVGSGDGAGGGVEFADVLGEIPAVGVPGTVDLDSQRTGSDGLTWVPSDVPQGWVGSAGEIHTSDLQVATIDIALVKRYTAVGCHLLIRATPHGIVGAFHDRVAFAIRECNRTILCIVHSAPDTGFRLDKRLISIGIELRDERSTPVYGNGGVLIERIGIVHGDLAILQREFTIAYVIIGVLVILAADRSFHQFGAGIVGKSIVHNCPLSSGITGGRSPEGVVAVLALSHQSRATMISHAGEQVTSCFVCLCERHVIRLGKLVQQVGAAEVPIAKLLNRTAVGEAGGYNAAICPVTGCNRLLYRAVLGVGVTGVQ